MTTDNNELKNQVDDAFSYLESRIFELKEDDQYYIKELMRYIERLEYENEELKEQIRLINNIFQN